MEIYKTVLRGTLIDSFLTRFFYTAMVFFLGLTSVWSQITTPANKLDKKIDELVAHYQEEGNIPGLSIVIIENEKTTFKNYGYATKGSDILVNSNHLFELGDNSLAFTALAVLQLAKKNQISLDAHISSYLPGFVMDFKGNPYEITIRQLLHHTSGIKSNMHLRVQALPDSTGKDAVTHFIRDSKLIAAPGAQYTYSVANYILLNQLMETVTGVSSETLIRDLVLSPLELESVKTDKDVATKQEITGHKINFYTPKVFKASYAGHSDSGMFLAANAKDLASWMQYNIEEQKSPFDELIKQTHLRNEDVALHDAMLSYAMGWQVSLRGNNNIFEKGSTPNYSSFIAFNKTDKNGVAVLANMNSPYTTAVGESVMQLLSGEQPSKNLQVDNKNKLYAFLAIILFIYTGVVFGYLCWVLFRYFKKKRSYIGLKPKMFKRGTILFLALVPFIFGLYLLPNYLGYGNWTVLLNWYPGSLKWFCYAFLMAIGISYVVYMVSSCFPEKNRYYNKVPQIILFSIISGLSDVVIISMITSSFNPELDLTYQIFYYMLVLGVYLVGRRQVQYHLINISLGLVYDLRIKLTEKIFGTSYQNFEEVDKGRVYSTLDQDVGVIGNAAGTFTGLVISSIAITGTFVYLATLEVWTTLILFVVIMVLTLIYYFVSKKTDIYYEEARDERGVFMRLLDGMIHGFKEIDLHKKSKEKYKVDIEGSARRLRDKIILADINFLNAQLFGESMLLLLLGIIVFGLPLFYSDMNFYLIASFVIVLLYILSPLQSLLNSGPELMRFKVAFKRITNFIADMPVNITEEKPTLTDTSNIYSFEAKGITFSYPRVDDAQENFGIGPIDFEASRGEIIFIIGANGSGKSTLAKLLIGLYEPGEGAIFINGEQQHPETLGEYFSVVFNPPYLFKKLYNVDKEQYDEAKVEELINILGLDGKVSISNNEYSTTELSSGQRKRLGLLQCYLEDAPLFLFDEWAADQDPHYRNFFYKKLLPEMRRKGKIVIAITHDDNYFHVADRVLEMKNGALLLRNFEQVEPNIFL